MLSQTRAVGTLYPGENPDILIDYQVIPQDCNTSIALEPHFVKPKLRRALALRSQERWEESKSGYLAVLKLDPSCIEAKG